MKPINTIFVFSALSIYTSLIFNRLAITVIAPVFGSTDFNMYFQVINEQEYLLQNGNK